MSSIEHFTPLHLGGPTLVFGLPIGVSNIVPADQEGLDTIYRPGQTMAAYGGDTPKSDRELLKDMLAQHLREQGIDPATNMSDEKNALKTVLETNIRRNHNDNVVKHFDFSALLEQIESMPGNAPVRFTMQFSQADIGTIKSRAAMNGITVSYDGNLGLMTIEGNKAALQEFVDSIYFFADVTKLQHFWIDVKIESAEAPPSEDVPVSTILDDALLSSRIYMYYESASGFYVVRSGHTVSSGSSTVEDPIIFITNPMGLTQSYSSNDVSYDAAGFNILGDSFQFGAPTQGELDDRSDTILPVHNNPPPINPGEPNNPPPMEPEEPNNPPPIEPEEPNNPPSPPVNNAPVNAIPAAQNVTINSSKIFSSGNGNAITVSDANGDNPLTVNLSVAHGTLTLAGTAGITITAGADSSADITIQGSAANINAALNGLTYTPTAAYTGADAVHIVTSDGRGGSDTDDLTLTVSNANSSPINTVPIAQTLDENTSQIFSSGNGNAITVSDADGDNPLTVSLSVAQGTLTLAGITGLTITAGADGSAAMTIEGSAADINAALEGLTYTPTAAYTGNDAISIITSDGNGGSDTDSVAISVDNINDAPINSVPAAQSVNENASLTLSGANALSVSDADGDSPLTVSLSVAQGTLTLAVLTGLTITAGADGSGAVTFEGSAADINAALDGLVYTPSAAYVGADSISIVTSDGNGGSDSDSVAVTVSNSNDAPVNSVPAAQNVNEDSTLTLNGVNAISVTDADGDNPLTVSLSVAQGTLTLSGTTGLTITAGADGSGALTIEGSAADINAALNGLSYLSNVNYVGADSISIVTSDGNGGSDSDSVAITVSNVNDAPVNSVPVAQNVTENSSLTLSSGNSNAISVNDLDGDTPLTVSLSVAHGTLSLAGTTGLTITAGADGSAALTIEGNATDINAALNGLIYAPTAAYTGSDAISIVTNDGNGGSDSDSVALTVNDLNFAPVLDNSGAMNLTTIVENNFTSAGDTVTSIINSSTANGSNAITDADSDPEGIAIITADNTNGQWQYNSGSGWTNVTGVSSANALHLNGAALVRFVPNSDYSGTPGGITFHAWDQSNGVTSGNSAAIGASGGNSGYSAATESASISITNINTTPTISGFATTLTLSESTAQAVSLIDNSITLTDPDSSDFSGGQLRLQYAAAGLATDQISVRNQGSGAGQIGFAAGTVSYGGVAIATVNGTNNGVNGNALILDLNSNASLAAVKALIENLQFATTSQVHDSSRIVNLSVSDGDGATSAVNPITLTVTDNSENYTFTAALDSFLGGTASDTISGAAANWGSTDVINLGSGTDIINLTTAGSASIGTSVSGSFTVNMSDVGNFGITIGAAPATSITINGSTLTGTNRVNVNSSAYLNILSVTGTGAGDAVTLGGGTQGYTLGAGNDSITGSNTTITANKTVSAGSGTDILFVNNSTIASGELAGYTGLDQITLLNTGSSITITDALIDSSDHGDNFFLNNLTFTVFINTTLVTGSNKVFLTGTSNVTFSGNVYVNDGVNGLASGSNTADGFYGGTGNDSVTSGNGNDTLYGGSGNDTLIGGANNDSIFGEDGNDILTGDNESDVVDGGNGNDSVSGGALNDRLTGGSGLDTLIGGEGIDTIIADEGADVVNFTETTDVIDTLIYAAVTDSTPVGMDSVSGFSLEFDIIDVTGFGTVNYIDDDSFSNVGTTELRWEQSGGNTFLELDSDGNGVADFRSRFTGNLAFSDRNFTGITNLSAQIFDLTTGLDNLSGDEGDEEFEGFNSEINAGDTIIGGSGEDTLRFLSAANANAATFANMTDIDIIELTVNGNTLAITDALINTALYNDLYIRTPGLSLTLDTSGVSGANRVLLIGTGSSTTIVTLQNGVNNQNVFADSNTGRFSIAGGSGDDEINGGTLNDSLHGGAGNDYIINTGGNDIITGGLGNDTIISASGADRINGNENDDSIDGAIGNDTIYGDDGNDTILGSSGNDTIYGGNQNDNIDGGSQNDVLYGENDNDTLFGNANNDTLWGGDGNDSLNGGTEADTINGGNGIDTLTGGTLGDVFDFDTTSESGIGVGNRDIITDYVQGTDRISFFTIGGLSLVSASGTAGGGAADLALVAGGAEVAWGQTGGNTIIYVDGNGDDIADMQIQITGLHSLTGGDFLL